MSAMFQVVEADGIVRTSSPKIDAYKYMAMLQRQGRTTSLTVQDGRYTVESAGLMAMTFTGEKTGTPVLHIVLSTGEHRTVDIDGWITRPEYEGSSDWIFLGFSTHHWHNRVTISLADVFANPDVIKGKKLYGWDRDHGSTRQWGSKSIVTAYVETQESAR